MLSSEAQSYLTQNSLARHLLLQMTRTNLPHWGLIGSLDTLKGVSNQNQVVFQGSLADARPHIGALVRLGILEKRANYFRASQYSFKDEVQRGVSPDPAYREKLGQDLDKIN